MSAYILRRALQGIVKLVIISFIMFVLTNLSGDPLSQYTNNPRIRAEDRERIRAELGLNQPIPFRYVGWIKKAAVGDFGFSFSERRPVIQMIGERLPDTLLLMVVAETVLISLSLLVGIYQATHQYGLADNLLTGFSFVGISMPVFFVGLALLLIFAVQFKLWNKAGATWLPYLPTGTAVWDRSQVSNWVYYMILPVATLVIIQVAGYARFVRSSVLEVLSQDYIRVARAKGLIERVVVARHALKNAALPFITIIGLDIPLLLAGAVVTESVFSWRGMGRLFINSANNSDFPVVMGILMLVTVAVIFFQILVDVIYTLFDPRIKLA